MSQKELENVTKHYKYSQRFNKVGDTNIWVEINNLSREQNAVDLAEVTNFECGIKKNLKIEISF